MGTRPAQGPAPHPRQQHPGHYCSWHCYMICRKAPAKRTHAAPPHHLGHYSPTRHGAHLTPAALAAAVAVAAAAVAAAEEAAAAAAAPPPAYAAAQPTSAAPAAATAAAAAVACTALAVPAAAATNGASSPPCHPHTTSLLPRHCCCCPAHALHACAGLLEIGSYASRHPPSLQAQNVAARWASTQRCGAANGSPCCSCPCFRRCWPSLCPPHIHPCCGSSQARECPQLIQMSCSCSPTGASHSSVPAHGHTVHAHHYFHGCCCCNLREKGALHLTHRHHPPQHYPHHLHR
mmetsp:Transcript_30034/g.77863  ORF Transcript_30034/g.77863 Transcript_30034/m.77863 type:complete len:291 (+) Transcript_30034:342-1214(+)